MDIRSMRYILEVMQTGSFTKAAHNLYISPQALGKAVRAVEEELDTEVFIRDTHSLQTTAFGRAFGREAEACVAAYDQACMRIHALARQAAGSINIACAYGIPSALGYENPSVLRQILKPCCCARIIWWPWCGKGIRWRSARPFPCVNWQIGPSPAEINIIGRITCWKPVPGANRFPCIMRSAHRMKPSGGRRCGRGRWASAYPSGRGAQSRPVLL